MRKGTIYYIKTDDNPNVDFTETEYYDILADMRIGYTTYQDRYESREALEILKSTIKEIGAEIREEHDEPVFPFSFSFVNADQAKYEYFAPRLDRLKKQVNKLTTDNMIHAAPDLDLIRKNEYGDLIAGPESYGISLDEFIRQIQSGVTYYVYNKTIQMH